MLKKEAGAFSNFRGTAEAATASMLALDENPEQTLADAMRIYKLLKKEFWGSAYLTMAAFIIARMAAPEQYEQLAERTRTIYKKMKAEHPFLTSGEDSAFCALLALSEKSDDDLIGEMEMCYGELKGHFYSSNAVQSLSHVLALCDGAASEKCERTLELYERLKQEGRKYGTEYELPTLGILAMSGDDPETIVSEMLEADEWLSEQKGFGFWGSVTKKQRLMYAGILAQNQRMDVNAMQTAAVGSTIAMIVAQEAAMCAVITASAAASRNSGTN